jgi:hypothetical protein
MLSIEALLLLIVVVVIGLLLALVVSALSTGSNPLAIGSKLLSRPPYSYPDRLPGPSPTSVIQGVDTSLMPLSLHDETNAIREALMDQPSFARGIDQVALSDGADMIGYPGSNEKVVKYARAP